VCYAWGPVVPVAAGAWPASQSFKQWTGATVVNAVSPTTKLTMPAAATTVTATYQSAALESPYQNASTGWPIPGKIEAENYDSGGEGLAYHDTTPGNSGGV